jgi:molybdopterin converting factor subunit 1
MSESGFPVRVLLFGPLRELAGVSELNLTVPEGGVVSDVLAAVSDRVAISVEGSGTAVAVNRRYACPDRPLRPGDEVALIPPVAGG